MKHAIHIRHLVLFGLLLATVQVWAAGPEARLDRTRIGEGETVTLIISVPGGSNGTPDLSPVTQDFDVLNQSQSMHMSMINGRSSSSRSWQYVLAPKRTGKLTIPAIRVDSASTGPLSLDVLPAADAAKAGPAAPVFMEVEVEPQQPYVQQKVIYTARLLSRVPLRQAHISDPQATDALVEPLGPETEYTTQRDGQQYRVSERRYAVFPQRSGTLQIDGPVLSAEVPEQNPRGGGPGQTFRGRDPFADFDRLFGRSGLPSLNGAFTQTRPIRLRARQLKIDVLAQPAGSASPWLPAESLTLNETWSENPPVFRVGEPVTRTVAITAQGLSAAQLPDLALDAGSGIKVYPDKPQAQARVDGNTLVAQKVIRAALVPSHSGALTLPAVRVAWWDTGAGEQHVAELPARAIEVLPAAAGAAAQRPPPSTQAVPEARAAATIPDAAGAARSADSAPGYWPWVAALLALAWLATAALWWRARQHVTPAGTRDETVTPETTKTPSRGERRAALARIEQAFRGNDVAAARRALIDWAAVRWPDDPPRRLDLIARRLGGDAEAVCAQVDAQLYANASSAWDGAAAWQVMGPLLAHGLPDAGVAPDTDVLPPLYPQGA